MDAFVSRKKRKTTPAVPDILDCLDDESTDIKLATLSSLLDHNHNDLQTPAELLEILLSCDGSVSKAWKVLGGRTQHDGQSPPQKKSINNSVIGIQTSLKFAPTLPDPSTDDVETRPKFTSVVRPLTRRGRTLHLYSPDDIAQHTPCSVVHNFLPPSLANSLLQELLPETATFESIGFKLFDNVVKSPHTACFYVDSLAERESQRHDFLYNGSNLEDVREILPVMRRVSDGFVQPAVNEQIATRIREHYPEAKKLRYQSPKEWRPNAAFVNCYDGGMQSVGYHSDQLTYLGPRAVIGSLSLGVAREFRVRKTIAKDEEAESNDDDQRKRKREKGEAADASGQIAIHLPHNSLLVMHAEMQEEWKHSIAPAQSIDPHPIAGNKRVNVTYRWYREEFHPRFIPKCKCGVPTVLKCVQRQRRNRGRYMWMCQTPGRPDGAEGCGHFEWARFTEDGVPIW